jgi:AbrB family looped-hinge helix DNA binding protein
MTAMKARVTLDRTRRITLPKRLREAWHLVPGDVLQLESEGDWITLRPLRRGSLLKKEYGVWVYQGKPTDASIPGLIDRQREKRLRPKSRKG